jgi:tetratricopeptide (TPR) repeat protein
MRGLANMMQDLRAVLDWYPELADAYNLLGMARVEGGGINSALEAQKQAIALAPRNVEYQFNLGQIYVAGKKWDQAREVFTRVASGTDRQAVVAAKQQLEDLDTLQKYGIRPQRAGQVGTPAGAASAPVAQNTGKPVWSNGASDEDEEADVAPKPAPPNPAKTGAVENLKGKIVVSDCSHPPGALITVISGMATYTMHAADYKTLLVIGEDQFSCEWKNRAVSVNYRPTGKNMGEVVSIELR